MSTNTTRQDTIAKLTEDTLDLLVVGGGIVGTGIARDAAMRGLRVGLVDKHDFASGTSSRSSRLLHGGLRYLAQGRIGLVREASIEKRIVHELAPHICAPMAFVLPTYNGTPWAPWALWKLRIGVRIYDLLCSGRNFGKSSDMIPTQVDDHLPGIRTPRLTGAVRYFDGLTNDARLAIDTLHSATNAGAAALNYCKMEEAFNESNIWNCTLTNQLTGNEIRIKTKSVVNATGPWAQQFKQNDIPLRVTKGIHIVIDKDRLPIPEAVVMTEGKRILFAIPWGHRVILGTSDTDYANSLDEVYADNEDITYVIQVTNESFPNANLTTDDVISTWAGLRPLIADPNGKPSDISRSHEIHMSQPGWYNVAGGKLTTYRLMAEQTVDQIQRYLDAENSPCRTASIPLLEPNDVARCSAIVPCEVSADIVEHCCQKEWALHLEDVMIRRTGWHYYIPNASDLATHVANWMAQSLNWSEADTQAELKRYRTIRQNGMPGMSTNCSQPITQEPQSLPNPGDGRSILQQG